MLEKKNLKIQNLVVYWQW